MNLPIKVSTANLRSLLLSLILLLCGIGILSPVQAMNFTSNESAADGSEPAIRTQGQTTNVKLELLVPLYIYPGTDWEKIVNASSQVPITVIINPASGPGSGDSGIQNNSDYHNGINMLRRSGVKVLGYVHTKKNPMEGTLRNLDDIKGDVDKYTDPANNFQLDGIFFDEVTSRWGNHQADLDDYQLLYNYVKTKSNKYLVVLNPGTNLHKSYLNVGNTAIIFEGTPNIFNKYKLDSYVSNYSSERFAMLAHNISDVNSMQDYLNWAMRNNIRYVYVTKDSGDNPWDTLPSYWEQEVDYIKQLNSCSNLTQQAEAGVRTGGFQIVNESNASNGQYMHVPNHTAYRDRPYENKNNTYCFTLYLPISVK